MNKLQQYALHFLKLELIKQPFDHAQDRLLEVFQNESGGRGVDLIIKTKTGQYHEVLLQVLNLETTERSVKIPKSEWDYELADNRWIALVLFMKEMEPKPYLIPSNVFKGPDEYIFFDNDQGERMKHLSNCEQQSSTFLSSRFPLCSSWEIKVFSNGIEELSEFALANSVKKLL